MLVILDRSTLLFRADILLVVILFVHLNIWFEPAVRTVLSVLLCHYFQLLWRESNISPLKGSKTHNQSNFREIVISFMCFVCPCIEHCLLHSQMPATLSSIRLCWQQEVGCGFQLCVTGSSRLYHGWDRWKERWKKWIRAPWGVHGSN